MLASQDARCYTMSATSMTSQSTSQRLQLGCSKFCGRTCQLCDARLCCGTIARALQLCGKPLLTQLHKLCVTKAALSQLCHSAARVLGLELQALQHPTSIRDAAVQLQVLAALQDRQAGKAEGACVIAAAAWAGSKSSTCDAAVWHG